MSTTDDTIRARRIVALVFMVLSGLFVGAIVGGVIAAFTLPISISC